MPQGSDKRLGSPVAKRGLHLEALASACPTPQPRHLGRRACLVNKHQPLWPLDHPRLAVTLPQLGPKRRPSFKKMSNSYAPKAAEISSLNRPCHRNLAIDGQRRWLLLARIPFERRQ